MSHKEMLKKSSASNAWTAIFKTADFSDLSSLKVTKLVHFSLFSD